MVKDEKMYVCPDKDVCHVKGCFHRDKHTISDCEDFSRPRLGCPPCIPVEQKKDGLDYLRKAYTEQKGEKCNACMGVGVVEDTCRVCDGTGIKQPSKEEKCRYLLESSKGDEYSICNISPDTEPTNKDRCSSCDAFELFKKPDMTEINNKLEELKEAERKIKTERKGNECKLNLTCAECYRHRENKCSLGLEKVFIKQPSKRVDEVLIC